MDTITITDLEVYANHGVLPEEQQLGQRFMVNVQMRLDLRQAGETDDLSKTVDYGRVCQLVEDEMTGHTYRLIEAAAEHVAQAILVQFPLVQHVRVEVKKPQAPIKQHFGCVSVVVERGRE